MEQPIPLRIFSIVANSENFGENEQKFFDELNKIFSSGTSITFPELIVLADKYDIRVAEKDTSDLDLNNVGQGYWLLKKHDSTGAEFGNIDPHVTFKYIYNYPPLELVTAAKRVLKGELDIWEFREQYDIKSDADYKLIMNFIEAKVGSLQLKTE